MTNIERDATAFGTSPRMKHDNGNGLNLLSGAIKQFQGKPHFRAGIDPEMPKGLDRLSGEWVDLTMQEIFNIWTVLGGRYVPSALYKNRMLPVQSGAAKPVGAPIKGLGLDVKS